MPIDMFDPRVLRRVVANTPPAPAFLLNAFFPEIDEATTEIVEFHVVNGRRRIAPFVSPLVAGKIITESGYTVNSLSPAYVKDKRVFDPTKYFKRMVGERIGGDMTPEQRRQLALRMATADQIAMLTTRLEKMAAEALLEGRATITGDLYPTKVVNFGRKSNLRKVLAGATRFGQTGVDILGLLEDWADEVFAESGEVVTDIAVTPDVWRVMKVYFATNETARKLLDTNVKKMSEALIELGPVNIKGRGARLVGTLSNWRLWVYSSQYEDESGQVAEMLPAGSLIMASSGLDGVRHFGAIKDEDAGLQAMQFFQKSWVEKDPSMRVLLMQSAPLVVPYRTNATLGATVL